MASVLRSHYGLKRAPLFQRARQEKGFNGPSITLHKDIAHGAVNISRLIQRLLTQLFCKYGLKGHEYSLNEQLSESFYAGLK